MISHAPFTQEGTMEALVFGAGNIGRGFLGALLSGSGFATTFVDVDVEKVGLLNNERCYPVFIASASGFREEMVRNVRAVALQDTEAVIRAITSADVILTAVGKRALEHVAPLLAQGLVSRKVHRPASDLHVVVVACENVQDNTTYLKDLIFAHLDSAEVASLQNDISFPNCVVDRIVPNIVPQNVSSSPLSVVVEEYYQLAIDISALRGALPTIQGVELSVNLDATLEQKLFTLNMAHAIVGYFGYLSGYQFVHEAMQDGRITELLAGAIAEVSHLLTLRHPGISSTAQNQYAQKIIHRFQNPFLRDEVTRVARQPLRKLGPDDRLVRPAALACMSGHTPAFLSSGITAALHFDFSRDTEAEQLVVQLREYGIDQVLKNVSGIVPTSPLGRLVKSNYLLRSL